MADVQWRGPVNQILYGVMFTPALDDTVVAEMADAMASRRYFLDGPETYRSAILAALGSSDRLVDALETPHSEADFRAFLSRLADRLA